MRTQSVLILTILFISMLANACAKHRGADEPLTNGMEMLLPGNNIYVMHSMIYAKEKPWTTSNIFIIRGTGDTVWIYGSGYGDFTTSCDDDCNDNNYYLGPEFRGTGPATSDVKPIDSLITNVFGLSRDSVVLEFIVPHYHNDHINEEFIDAFYSYFKYPLTDGEKIWIHINDSIGALCDEPCCGTSPCPDKDNKYYGVPYMPHWKPEYKAMFIAIGKEDDECNEEIKHFTSACGEWKITKAVAVKDEGHTDGTINLNNAALQLRICGTKSKVQCDLPDGWQFVTVHNNMNLKK